MFILKSMHGNFKRIKNLDFNFSFFSDLNLLCILLNFIIYDSIFSYSLFSHIFSFYSYSCKQIAFYWKERLIIFLSHIFNFFLFPPFLTNYIIYIRFDLIYNRSIRRYELRSIKIAKHAQFAKL